ncbi:hypothetical protein [Pseudaquabacterium pictum]|uniref:Bacteriophage tail tape measure N-terminal domain-containing protein n=1 Tax=Pseudaquabacterium pictum TaxID=2315236 RepID=A0A480ARW1_9BURK|nr:hypothetical protein [Rubrivivax pictus]GCL61488.1 hypothetical protein AQPW35_05690 [Rubrivivax pictus]
MTIAGAIEIQMLADLARLKKDMDQAKGMVGSATAEMQRYADITKTALGAIGVGLSLGALKQMVQDSIDAAEALNDMAIVTGVSVENLSALTEVGRTTGTTLDTIGSAVGRLAKNMAGSTEESRGAAQAVKALGINFDEFKRMQGDQQLLTLAQAMDRFADGSGKSAAAQALLGKEGAKLLPFMKDLASSGELVATVTAEQAAMADRYNDSVEATRMRVDALKRDLAMGLLPTMVDLHDLTIGLGKALGEYLTGDAKAASGQADVLALALGGVGTVLETMLVLGANVGFVFKQMGRDIGASAAAFVEMQKWNFAGARQILAAATDDGQANRAALDAFEKKVLGATDRALQARSALRNGGTSRADDARELARMDEATGRAAKGQLQYAAAAEKTKKAVQEQRAELDKLFERLGVRGAEQAAELQGGQQLTQSQKEALDIMVKLRDGTLKLTEAQQLRLASQIELIDQQERHIAIQKAEAQLQADMLTDRQQIEADLAAETARLAEAVSTQREQNLALALGADAYAQLQQARLRARADELESIATTSTNSDELRKQAALVREQAGLLNERRGLEGAAKPLGNETYTEVRDALAAAFRDTKNPVKAFAEGLGNAIFSRVTSRLADAMAIQLVGSSGAGGLFGSVLSGLGSLLGGGVPFGDGTGATGDFARFDRMATPLATGTNYVPRDNFPALLHEGEAVVPKAFNPAAGGGSAGRQALNYAPVYNINVDSRADRAAVQQDVAQIVADGSRRQMAELQRLGVLA